MKLPALLLAGLGLLLASPAAAAGDRADEFLAAFRAGDEAAMAEVARKPFASEAGDPFYVANEFFARHAEGTLADPPRPGDFLDAADALEKRVRGPKRYEGLAALLRRWRSADRDALRRELDLRRDVLADETPAGAPPGITLSRHLRMRAGRHADAGRFEEARADYRAAAEAAREAGWFAAVVSNLWQIGYLHLRRGDMAAARTIWEEELDLLAGAGEGAWHAETLLWIGTSHAGLGDYARAEEFTVRALQEAEDSGNRWSEANAREELGRLQGILGRYARALDLLEEARRTYEGPCKSQVGAASALGHIGALYGRLGRPERAVEALVEAIRVIDSLGAGYRGEAARVRGDLGTVYEEMDRFDEAERVLERARADRESVKDRPAANDSLLLLAGLRLRSGRTEAAARDARRALTEATDLGDRAAVGRARALLGEALRDPAETGRAVEELEAVGDRFGAARTRRTLAALLLADRPEEALARAGEAVEAHAALAAGLGEEYAAGLRGGAREAADIGIEAALRVGTPAAAVRAFHLSEMSRGLLLAEGIANRDALLSAAIPQELRAADAAARARAAAVRRDLVALAARPGATPEQLLRARADLDGAASALADSVARVQREARRVADIVYPRPCSLSELQAALAPDEAVVVYQFTPARAAALVVDRDGLSLRDLGEAPLLARRAEEWVDLVAADGSDEEPAAAALYDALLRPLEADLAGRRRIRISPDGALAFLPFEALLRVEGTRRERAVERWEFSYLPSATVLAALRADAGKPGARGSGILALGDPLPPGEPAAGDAALRGYGRLRRLPGTAAEAEAIGALVPAGRATLLLREKATAGNLRAALGAADGRLAALHLACHGCLDAEHPRLTGLVLTGGEVLTLDDVYRMRVPADLVVLSACESGRGPVVHGEGAMGLSRAFLFAGARRVVVSDWAVSDEATRLLMVSFYEGMLRGGRDAGEALRAAKVERLRAGGPGAHPARWAAFVLWGADRD